MTTDLREIIVERIDAVTLPVGDLDRIRSTGRRIRFRRRAVTGAATAGVVLAAVVVLAIDGNRDIGERAAPDRTEYASLGPLDFSAGIRAYGDPGGYLFLGGRRIDAADLDWLDTDAVATSYGIVFYDEGRPMLLEPSGEFSTLADGPVDKAFQPTAKAEAAEPVAVWATRSNGQVEIVVQDIATREVLATGQPDCGRCPGLTIDGIDGGVVFVRDDAGTRTWDSATGEWADFAGPRTRVADVRNGVVLFDGPAPDRPGRWRTVAGAIDAQLSFDGSHVLYWSSTLEPTTAGGEPIVLERGPADGDGLGWWTFDTDGSVLVATGKRYGDYTVYDCELPSGTCEALGELKPTGGDPMFIGNDM